MSERGNGPVDERDGQGGGERQGGSRRRGLQACAALAETWGSLAEACFELSATEWALPTECPGWDVKDQLSHLIGIERFLMGESAPEWDRPLGDHVRNDFAISNEPWIAVRRSRSGAAVRAEFVEVTARRLAELETLTEAQWDEVVRSPVGALPLVAFLGVRVFDSWVHEQDVRRALDRPGGVGTLASAMALDQAQLVMPRVVAKQGGCADGAVVRFDIAGSGDDGRSFGVAVEGGRGRPVGDEVPPTVIIEVSAVDFVRLGAGRTTASLLEAAGGVSVRGDLSEGRRVLDAMNFTF